MSFCGDEPLFLAKSSELDILHSLEVVSPSYMMHFWNRFDKLLESVEVVVDRPKGSRHPKYSHIIYPLDYGYLRGTSAGDGNEIDVWCGSDNPKMLVAVICTVDTLKNDTEVKLLLGCTEREIELVDRFHNDNEYMSGLMIKRKG